MPAGHAPLVATVALPPAPSVAAAPLTVSLAATLTTAVPPVPVRTLPLSGWATGLATSTFVTFTTGTTSGCTANVVLGATVAVPQE